MDNRILFTLVLEKNLKIDFERIVKSKDLNMAQVVRGMIRDYVKENSQQGV